MAAPRFRYIEWENRKQTVRGSLHAVQPRNGIWYVFCHGFTGHRIGPGYLFVHLARELETIGASSLRFDFRGSGESDGHFKDMTIDSMCSDLLSAVSMVRKRYEPSVLVLLGHSLGGMVASLCCDRTRADGLALLAPVADPEGLVDRRRDIINAGPNTAGCYENGPHEMSLSFIDGLRNVDPAAAMAHCFRGRLFLVQGDADASVAVGESARYVQKARQSGISAAYYILKNADHNFGTVFYFRNISRYLKDWTKGFSG
ncbi:MAG: alpha/beta fold hydrolase [Chitinispirillaceae bacterium]|nr:alpha/beta fold hydrolase [Chitinispirillaceae bacterium]